MLEFKNLHAGYNGEAKLHGLNVKLEPGRLIAVIGPNGCGKSTLLKCAAGLLKPMQGEILLDGANLSRIPERERARRISYMPQSRLAPEISVRALALHGRYPHLKWGRSPGKREWEIVDAEIARVELSAYAQRSVLSLSGGERQRAYLAMMLAQQTRIMLLDEPTAYLDLSSQFALMELLSGLKSENRCVVAVLHDLALALEYADEIWLMQDGRLIASGSPEEIYASEKMQSAFEIEICRTANGKYVFYPEKRRREYAGEANVCEGAEADADFHDTELN